MVTWIMLCTICRRVEKSSSGWRGQLPSRKFSAHGQTRYHELLCLLVSPLCWRVVIHRGLVSSYLGLSALSEQPCSMLDVPSRQFYLSNSQALIECRSEWTLSTTDSSLHLLVIGSMPHKLPVRWSLFVFEVPIVEWNYDRALSVSQLWFNPRIRGGQCSMAGWAFMIVFDLCAAMMYGFNNLWQIAHKLQQCPVHIHDP